MKMMSYPVEDVLVHASSCTSVSFILRNFRQVVYKLHCVDIMCITYTRRTCSCHPKNIEMNEKQNAWRYMCTSDTLNLYVKREKDSHDIG